MIVINIIIFHKRTSVIKPAMHTRGTQELCLFFGCVAKQERVLPPSQRGCPGPWIRGNGFLAPPIPLHPLRKPMAPFISLAKRQRECLILYLKFLVPTVSIPSSQRTLNGYLKSFVKLRLNSGNKEEEIQNEKNILKYTPSTFHSPCFSVLPNQVTVSPEDYSHRREVMSCPQNVCVQIPIHPN